MSRLGADPAALRRLASAFDRASESLDDDARTIATRLRAAGWQGPDAQRYLAEWDTQHRPALRTVASVFAATATTLRDQAKEQELASGVSADTGAAAAGGGGGTSADGGGVSSHGDVDRMPDPPGVVADGLSYLGLGEALVENWYLGQMIAAQREVAALADGLQEATLLTRTPTVAELAGTTGTWLGHLGTGLGIVDVGLNAWNLIDGIQEGDVGQVADGVIGGGLAVAGMIVAAGTPVGWAVLGAGAAWAGLGLLADNLGYENTSDMIWDGVTWVGEGIADAATGAWQGVEDAAGAVAHAGEEFLEGAGDALDAVGDWFK
ncbi:hypothetical protein Xcel_1467 [Xylanimonas cellulosilytica DSM 15894]|uniref:WXG100 family type VII secretion target n=1 Tax=Xylanimonas cellulosilytica (strain DSM 15894 / JCM 12276 / CECT 5975 / KCTC 9989 / LMG 20990 / NBRC 107835 / XIL07) TaxID=446471 RepID=D1BS06_XYLCX|nr:hypothetical protein [Xylanimonas cellulosilytica]ACZ30498.1 hypothetical protein Xcel_1467 [Xylanimonas cellulosilytica DSM 15894]